MLTDTRSLSSSLRTHQHTSTHTSTRYTRVTHTQTMSFSFSPFPYAHTHPTHIHTHINLIHQGHSGDPLFLKHVHLKCPLPYVHMNTHIDHVLFFKSFSLPTHTSTHTHEHTAINTHPSTHSHQPLYTRVIRVIFTETRTHEMSSSLHTNHVLLLKCFSLSPFPYTH